MSPAIGRCSFCFIIDVYFIYVIIIIKKLKFNGKGKIKYITQWWTDMQVILFYSENWRHQ